MDLSGPNLSTGWRYPASRKDIKATLGSVPDLYVRLDKGSRGYHLPQKDASPVVAVAQLFGTTDAEPVHPNVVIYARRNKEYSDEAAEEFAEVVLPRIRDFLLEQVAKSGPAVMFGRPLLRVYWRNGSHDVEIRDTSGF